MQLEIYNPAQGETLKPIEWNFEELKTQIAEGLQKYSGVVFSDMAQAKAERANLNKLATAIDERRKEMKKRYLEPYTLFEAQCKELTGMIEKVSREIDKQVKAAEEAEKTEKLEEIKAFFKENVGDLEELLPYETIHDPKWLNKTVAMTKIKDTIIKTIVKVKTDLQTIDNVVPEHMKPRIMSKYLEKLDLSEALRLKEEIEAEEKRLEEYKRQQEEQKRLQEAQKPAEEPERAQTDEEPTQEPETVQEPVQEPTEAVQEEKLYTICFKVRGTRDQIAALGAYMRSHGLEYGRIK